MHGLSTRDDLSKIHRMRHRCPTCLSQPMFLVAGGRAQDGRRTIENAHRRLRGMMDHGTEDEKRVDKMSTRQAILTLASIHTTSMAVTNIIFDLCSYPEWFPVLREEIDNITAELGPIGSTPESGSKQWLSRLEKLDSFFLESQRMNPPILRTCAQ